MTKNTKCVKCEAWLSDPRMSELAYGWIHAVEHKASQ